MTDSGDPATIVRGATNAEPLLEREANWQRLPKRWRRRGAALAA